jgi:tetratricopeptide (TPR) repeat protein
MRWAEMRWSMLALVWLLALEGVARAGDFELCAQTTDWQLKLDGCTRLLSHDPKLAPAYAGRALALAAMGQTDRAIVDYSQALELDPGLSVAQYNRGLSYLSLDQPQSAAADFGAVIAHDPSDATAYNGRAIANAALGRFKAAEADFAKAIALDPAYARAFLGRANLWLSRSMFDAALADFDKVLELAPSDAEAAQGRKFAAARTLPPEFEMVGTIAPLSRPELAHHTSAISTAVKTTVVVSKSHKAPASAAPVRIRRGIQPEAAVSDGTCTGDFGQPCVVLSR